MAAMARRNVDQVRSTGVARVDRKYIGDGPWYHIQGENIK